MNVSFLQEICQSFPEALLNVWKPIRPFIPTVHTCMYLIYTSYVFPSNPFLSYTVERMWCGGTCWGNSTI